MPSPFGLGGFFGGFGGFFGRGVASVPAQDARQVAQAFGTFQQTYSQDVRSILLPARTDQPGEQPAGVQCGGHLGLGTLNTSIDATIANLPASSSLATTIQGELLGSGTNTLQTLLGAIPTPSNIGFRSFRVFNRESTLFINQIAGNVSNQVRTASAPTGSISQTTIQQDLSLVQTDFQTLQSDLLQRRADDPAAGGDNNPLEQSPGLRSGGGDGSRHTQHEHRLGAGQSPRRR